MGLKHYIKSKISILKLKIKEYFLLKNSLEHLDNFLKKFYVSPIGINDIYYGNKNMKIFIICIVICAFNWFAVGFNLSFVFSEEMFSLIDVPSIFGKHLKLLWSFGATVYFLTAAFRTDILLGQIHYNLNPLKTLYYLKKDLKELHKLNEKNYKKLAILSRSVQIIFMDCGTILFVVTITIFMIKIAILSGKIFWIWGNIIFILIIIISATTATSIVCLIIIMLFYYKMIFGQINDKINLISNEKSKLFKRRNLIINKTKRKQLISLIHEHNLSAIEIHKLNLITRRSMACVFIAFSMMKIISLYLLVNFEDFFIKLFLIIFNLLALIFGFSACYLFTLQIKSAHQPLKTVHSIVCKYKMDLRLRLKVS